MRKYFMQNLHPYARGSPQGLSQACQESARLPSSLCAPFFQTSSYKVSSRGNVEKENSFYTHSCNDPIGDADRRRHIVDGVEERFFIFL